MAYDIYSPQPNPYGQSVIGALQQLTQNALQQSQQQQQQSQIANALQGLGYEPQQAQQLAGFQPEILKEVIKQRPQQPAINPQQYQTLIPGLSKDEATALAGITPAERRIVLQNKIEEAANKRGAAGLKSIMPNLSDEEADAIIHLPKGLLPAFYKNVADTILEETETAPTGRVTTGIEPTTPEGIPAKPLTVAQKAAQKKQRDVLERETKKKQEEVDKKIQKFYDETIAEGKLSFQNEARLNRMDELIKRGKLPVTGVGSALKSLSKGVWGVGIDLSSLAGADAEEFTKISNDFIREAKSIFGSRMTDADLNAFLQMIPSLSQSDKGKTRIINNMRAWNDAKKVRRNAMEKIISENNGKRPENLEQLVEQTASPALDEIAKRVQLGYSRSYSTSPEGLKLPPASKYAVGATYSRGGKHFVNNGQFWEPYFPGR